MQLVSRSVIPFSSWFLTSMTTPRLGSVILHDEGQNNSALLPSSTFLSISLLISGRAALNTWTACQPRAWRWLTRIGKLLGLREVKREQPRQDVLVAQIVGPAVGIQHGLVELAMGQVQPGGTLVVEVG